MEEDLKTQGINDLKNYNALCASLQIIPRQIELVRNDSSQKTSSFNGIAIQASTEPDSKIVKMLSHIEMLENRLQQNTVKVQMIKAALDCLTPQDSEIIMELYINRKGKSIEEISLKLSSDRSGLYRRGRIAINAFVFAYYGIY